MSIDYQIRTDGNERYATFSEPNVYFEVPIEDGASEAEIQESLDRCKLGLTLGQIQVTQCRDDVYCSGALVRQDYTVATTEGAAIVAKLQERFPDHHPWLRNPLNVVGEYGAYREPYQNSSISWYDFATKPSSALLTSYSTSYNAALLKDWYGLKFDLTTNEVMLKVVLSEVDFDHPEMPALPFFAVTHRSDGTSESLVDAYVYATPEKVSAFCEYKGLNYPFPEGYDFKGNAPWIWGFVFNKDTQVYGSVKGYQRSYVT